MKRFKKNNETVDMFEMIVMPLEREMIKRGIKTFRYKNLKVVLSRTLGLAFSNGYGEVLYLHNQTSIMDECMLSVNEIKSDFQTLQEKMSGN